MQLGNVSVPCRLTKKEHVFCQFIQDTEENPDLLIKPCMKQGQNASHGGYDTNQLLEYCLLQALLFVSKYVTLWGPDEPRRRNSPLHSHEGAITHGDQLFDYAGHSDA